MKRLLFITNNLVGGGAEKILNIILSNLDYQKYSITVYSLHEPPTGFPLISNIDYHFIYRHKAKNSINGLLNKIHNKIRLLIYDNFKASVFYRFFIKGKYDIEISFIEGYSTRIISGSTNPKSKKYAWVHIDMENNAWSDISYRSKLEQEDSYRKFDGVISVSESVNQSISRKFKDIQNRFVLYNPIDERLIKSLASESIPISHHSRDVFRFISIGRLEKQKGYDRLIPIIASLRDKNFNVELWILGEGNQRVELENLISGLKLNDYVKLIGFQKNPYPFLLCSDAFVCSSRSEGYSTVITEALILGLPVVSTKCAGVEELLGINSEFGIITNNDVSSLEKGMIRLLNPQILNHYKERANRRGKDFRLDTLMQTMEDKILKS